ncbi:hypothetical protein MHUMG1_00346 [Metarhizium humberi]|uniref:Uncharacterized protein n=1 Tax=Metarhizium humberi TaxID=2596975 RepID=A0A9P8MIR3_9HYPO|nr:hypothetical protein MHUMG1_00346 [Metarhizium humberi]
MSNRSVLRHLPDAEACPRPNRHPRRRGASQNGPLSRRRPRESGDSSSKSSTALVNIHEDSGLSHPAAAFTSQNPAPVEPSSPQPILNPHALSRGIGGHVEQDQEPLELDSTHQDHHTMHIVGPAVTNDKQVLSDYLSGIPGATRSTRMIIPESAGRSQPVLFTMVQKRPVGLAVDKSPSAEKLAIIEKILEPFVDDIINEYFTKANECLPLLDEQSFRDQYLEDKTHISPALLSLAHGTPPHISRIQYDVPLPTLECLCEGDSSEARVRTANVFIALVRLTDVLDQHLQRVYAVDGNRPWDTASLELALNNWVESLTGSCRLIVIRGSRLEIPGAANLRLAYLTTRLLLQRMELEAEKRIYDQLNERIMNRYIQARRTAEEILLLLQELQAEQLGGFWLPVTAFAFPATVNFLLRCALEMESSLQGLARSSSFRIAQDIVATLRKYQKQFEWDLADICVAQHAEIVDRILGGVAREEESDNNMDIQEFSMPDASILDQYFPSLWDPLQNAW